MEKFKVLYNKCFCDADGRLTVVQFPNLSGGLTIGFIVLSWLVQEGVVYNLLRGCAAITGLWWAYLEVRYGVNYFRRAQGGVVIAMILAQIIRSLF